MPSVKDAARVAEPGLWTIPITSFIQTARDETLSVQFGRTQTTPRRFDRCKQLLASVKIAWQQNDPEWAKHLQLQGQLRDAQSQIRSAEAEYARAADAVRAALADGQDSSEAEARMASAGRNLEVLRARARMLTELVGPAKLRAESAWTSACPKLLREVQEQLVDELRAVRERLLSAVSADMLNALADITGEVQLSEDREITNTFSRP